MGQGDTCAQGPHRPQFDPERDTQEAGLHVQLKMHFQSNSILDLIRETETPHHPKY